MAKEICISSTPHETRLAILEDDQLAEIYYERENEYTLAGSIYNGRVTRVLPGMQSAFVDLGLERDAFLYVTDFIELEDQAEADELEHAAASAQPPREIQRGNGRPEERGDRGGGRQDERGAGRSEDRGRGHREPRQDSRREQQPRPELATESAEASTVEFESSQTSAAAPTETEGGQEAAGGGRRWRGRRHRRGGRGGAGQPDDRMPEATEAVDEFESAAAMPAAVAPSLTVEETPAAPGRTYTGERTRFSERAPSGERAHPSERAHSSGPAVVLPGESLSKYGGTPAPEGTKAGSSTPLRPGTTSKPSTLVETPLEWDPSSGLLPGESIGRRRERQPEAESETEYELAAPAGHGSAPGELEEEELVAEQGETKAPALHEIEFPQESVAPEELEELSEESPIGDEDEAEETRPGSGPEDAAASHRVDPSAPTGFRLFGLGGKKKKDEPAPGTTTADRAAAAATPATPAKPASNYTPGVGHIEEEVIEGEEFDSTPHGRRSRGDEHDLDDYEEQTMPAQARSGDLGEMFQEAHLDSRIQMRLGQAGGEEEDEAFDLLPDEGEDEGEEASSEGQPAPGQPRRERPGRDRGRRGRSGQRGGERQRGPSRRSMQTSDLPIISDLLKPGQEILVQIAKEPIAKKGARITSHIALPGRFLVFMPTVNHVGVSRKIASDEERHRLKRILVHERGEASGGFIVRTAADGASEDELRADLRFLMNLWNDIKQRSEQSKAPALIYHDLSLIERILRDQVSENFSNIWVDSEADYERIVRFLNRFSPSLVRRVKLYTKETPLFEHFGIQDEISKALRSKVWLKSGGSIVINQTEALVAIDINTGKYVGKSARLEDTILKTNLDAVPEIVRQIRLRDLGGIIVIDFIDMDERKNRFKVMAALEEALKSDRAPTKVLQFNDFGLVAITRKRVKQSLERTLSIPCPTCQATGMVKSPATVCNEIYIEMRKMRKHFENADVMLRVHPETVKVLKSNNSRWLTDFEELIGKNVLVKADATLHPEQFDIQG
jgi:Rne/Rng family ribonuclease